MPRAACHSQSVELVSKPAKLHWPGIEPGPPAWQARILPLNHQCQYFPTPGIEPGPPGWKPGILTTRPCRSWRSILRRFAKILCRLGLSWYCSWNLASLNTVFQLFSILFCRLAQTNCVVRRKFEPSHHPKSVLTKYQNTTGCESINWSCQINHDIRIECGATS